MAVDSFAGHITVNHTTTSRTAISRIATSRTVDYMTNHIIDRIATATADCITTTNRTANLRLQQFDFFHRHSFRRTFP